MPGGAFPFSFSSYAYWGSFGSRLPPLPEGGAAAEGSTAIPLPLPLGCSALAPAGLQIAGRTWLSGAPPFFICMRGPVWRVIGALVKGLRWLSGAPFLFACRGRPFGGAPYSLAQPPRSAAGRSVQQLQLPLHEVHGLLAPGQGARAALALHSKVALLPSLARVTTSYRSRRGGATSICRGKRRGVANVCRSSWHKVTSVCRSKRCYVLPHISL